jgi:hypothetical protein
MDAMKTAVGGLLALLLLATVSGCTFAPTAASRDTSASVAAELVARAWGGERGSSREALAFAFVRSLLDDRALAEAWKSKPALTSHEAYYDQLEKEGSSMLPDEALRRAAMLKLRLLEGATPDECASYQAMLSSGAVFGADGEKWRRRLTRASDDDFWQSLQLSKDAILERARRISEKPLVISKRDQEAAFAYLVFALPSATREELLAMADKSSDALSGKDTCKFAAALLRIQAESRGPEAYIPLRLWYATVKD